MSGGKPYLLLMNTDYNAFTPDLVEKYLQRSLSYGMFPGMFSHNAADNPYWQNPKWYERDRPQFKKYLPVIKQVAEAGWQPVTLAVCDNQHILVERFGPDSAGKVYLTLLNDSDGLQEGSLRLDPGLGAGQKPSGAREAVSGRAMEGKDSSWPITLMSQECKVLQLSFR